MASASASTSASTSAPASASASASSSAASAPGSGSADGLMHAAVYRAFHGPINIERVAKPSAPEDGVLLEVKATGVCRSDWHGWCGHDGDIHEHGLPFVPGHEVAGVIAEVGPRVTRFKVGDRVAVPVRE